MSTALLVWVAIGMAASVGLSYLALKGDRMVTAALVVLGGSLLSVVFIAEIVARVYEVDRGEAYIVIGSIEGALWLWTIVKGMVTG